MVGLETAFSIVYSTMVDTGVMDWNRLASVMSIAPAQIGRYLNHGNILEVGAPAHITLVDPKSTKVVNREELASKSKNTPFHGMNLKGTVVATIFNGHLTHRVGG
jgi:dihydroorotase